MKKKIKRVFLVILAVIVALCAAFFYFFPVGLYIHTLKVSTDEVVVADVRFDDTIHFKNNGQHIILKADISSTLETDVPALF